jgi:hypothetical protein
MDLPVLPYIEFISLDKLEFDPKNPRLPGNFDENDEQEVLKWMLGDASLVELMGSIGAQGYFPGEPLLGYKSAKGNYVIVEGNRRLAATKLLLHPEKAPSKRRAVLSVSQESPQKPSILPVIIYSHREDILSYLGYRHVTGIKAWDPLPKARYLKELFDAEVNVGDIQSKFRTLAKKIGSRADYVARLLTGYALYEQIEINDFFNIKDLDEESIDFSLLTTAINYNNISAFLGLSSATDPSLTGLNLERLYEIIDWLFCKNSDRRTRVGESRNLSYLSSIVANEKALAAWRNGATLQYSSMLTETPSEVFKKSVLEAQGNIRTARDYSSYVTLPEIITLDILQEIRQVAEDLFILMKSRLHA